MKKIITIFILSVLAAVTAFAQTDNAQALIDQGVELYDQGKYSQALEKYKQSFKLDSNSVVLFGEMAMTYLALKDYDNTESICQKAINKFSDDISLKNIYSTYGNSLDERKKPEEALKIYEEGISKFPDDYMLYFNKGITEYGLKRNFDARASFQKAITLNPNHKSSYFYLGILEDDFGNRIPAILAIAKFLILEPEGQRAKQVLPILTKKVNNLYYQEKTGNSITTYSSARSRTDTAENEFSDIEKNLGILSVFSTALPDKNKTELEKFETQMQTIFELLNSEKKNHSGFYWDVIAPYFIDLELKKQVGGFVYYINSFENDDKATQKVIKKNQQKIDDFVNWTKSYE